jgi:hypothetical protein
LTRPPVARPSDPVELARAAASGLSLKRDESLKLLRDLVAQIEELERTNATLAAIAARTQPTTPTVIAAPDRAEVASALPPRVGPCEAAVLKTQVAVAIRSPIVVRRTPTGAMHLGPEAARTYTPAEAIGLGREILALFEGDV